MFEATTYGKTLDILRRTMDVSLLRREVIANNIANAETPNFKRTDVNFEAELSAALASERRTTPQGRMTHPRHIAFDRPTDYRRVRPRLVLDYLTQAKNNGNNVDLEQELMQSTRNQMMYELMSEAVSHQIRSVNMVVR